MCFVKNIGLEERAFRITARSAALITIKDHKDNFWNNPKSTLLNPNKPEIGKVSKQIFKNVISVIRKKSKLIIWKNTADMCSHGLFRKLDKVFYHIWYMKLLPKYTGCHFLFGFLLTSYNINKFPVKMATVSSI